MAMNFGRRVLDALPLSSVVFVARESASASFLYATGDCIAQNLEANLGISSPGKRQYNYERTGRMAAFGFFFAGPILGSWYPMLHRITVSYRARYTMSSFPFTGSTYYRKEVLDAPYERALEVGIKLLFDNLFFQAPFLTLYFSVMSLLEGLSLEEAYDKTTSKFHAAWAYSLVLWVPTQAANFSFVPVPRQALCVNIVNVFWKTFLSILNHTLDYGPIGDGDALGSKRKSVKQLEELVVQYEEVMERKDMVIKSQSKRIHDLEELLEARHPPRPKRA